MENKDKRKISRRNFFKTLGAGSAVTATASLYGCKPDGKVSTQGALGEVPKDKMTYRVNNITGDKVSLLGYGCMRFPLRQRTDGTGEEIDQDAVNELVDYAIEHGVNYFDTAPVYIRGWSEEAMGVALSRHPRDKYFIATKASNQRGSLTLQEGINMYHKSMKDLQVDYIDYYLLHSIGGGEDGIEFFKQRFIYNGLLDYLLKEKAAGRIRNLGWSFHGDVKVFDYALAMNIQWDFVMIQMNYQDWQHADGVRNVNAEYLYGELEKKDIPTVVMEPLLGGRLARLNSQALNVLREIRPHDSAASWAFRYAGIPKKILSVLSGMTYMEHLQENIRTYSPLEPLEQRDYEALEKVTDIILNGDYVQCTECQYCMPCPYGVDIPNIFTHYNRIVTADQRLSSSKDANYKEARRAFLVGYDRNVPKLRQANHCIGCDICIPLCPQNINISAEMRRVDSYAEQLKQKLDF